MSLNAQYFNELYDRRDDPWRLAERWYERRKRALTMAVLPRERFTRALEVGCSIGTLTAELAPRCETLLAVDISERPIELARERLAGVRGVEFAVMNTPDEWPWGLYDLVVLSEVGYYLDEAQLQYLIDQSADSLTDDGVIVACHWRHPVADYPLRGDAVHAAFRSNRSLQLLSDYRDDDIRLEVFGRAGARSVAATEGLA